MGKYIQVNKHRMQKMFLHQKTYEVHTLNDVIILCFSVCEALKRYSYRSELNVTLPMSINFGIQLPSFNFNKTLSAVISLCKMFLRYICFTAVAH